ncbi:hypothetical protein ACFYZB_36275 [Streptomyces sp. NPDC001852]|uniref:hypothetical protein n=1 Tax=Streptomyces sp. NPDC001852 TaxID=3364619 RepID=UPI0036B668CC
MLRATGASGTVGSTRTTWTRGRRGAVTAASAAVVVLGGVLVACAAANGPGGGYVAVGSGQHGPTAAAPTGSVTLVPLEGARSSSGGSSPGKAAQPESTGPSGTPEQTTTAPGGDASPGIPSSPAGEGGSGGPAGRTTPPAAPSGPAPSGSTTSTPAELSWGTPATEPTDQRWCQKVTVGFRNSGGTAVRSGTVTFGTHIIGALGIDWGTVDSTVDLPVPIGPGAHEDHTWTVCVDAWRVPLGMHTETRDVSVQWK